MYSTRRGDSTKWLSFLAAPISVHLLVYRLWFGFVQEQLCSQADIIDEKRPAPLLCTLQALVDLKTALAKSATCAQTAPNSVHSRPNSRSKSSQPGPSSRSLSNRTTSSSGKQRSHPPLHSVVWSSILSHLHSSYYS